MRAVSGLELVASAATAAALSMAGSVALGEEKAADPRFAAKVAQTDSELGRPGSGGSSASRAARELAMVASVTVTLARLVLAFATMNRVVSSHSERAVLSVRIPLPPLPGDSSIIHLTSALHGRPKATAALTLQERLFQPGVR